VISDQSVLHKIWRRTPEALKPGAIKKALQRVLTSAGVTHEYFMADGADFAEIHRRFYAPRERRGPSGKAISSRHFDAVGTKTCQIMFPGRFNGILEADRHYIALDRNFSNIDEVMRRFRDRRYVEQLVDRTYEYIRDCHTYRHRMLALLAAIDQ
jgi:hypothetical protein